MRNLVSLAVVILCLICACAIYLTTLVYRGNEQRERAHLVAAMEQEVADLQKSIELMEWRAGQLPEEIEDLVAHPLPLISLNLAALRKMAPIERARIEAAAAADNVEVRRKRDRDVIELRKQLAELPGQIASKRLLLKQREGELNRLRSAVVGP